MATPFIIKRGLEASLPGTYTSGTMYFCTDTGNIYIDYDDNGTLKRQQVAKDALDDKQNVITGAASTITDSNLTASRVLVSNSSGKIAVSSTITTTELGYLNNIKSNVQDQLNNKSNLSIKEEVELEASSWRADKTYIYTHSNITETNVVELIPATNITEEEYEALQDAQIIGSAQAADSITLKAMGEVPTINIPVIFIIRGDM